MKDYIILSVHQSYILHHIQTDICYVCYKKYIVYCHFIIMILLLMTIIVFYFSICCLGCTGGNSENLFFIQKFADFDIAL